MPKAYDVKHNYYADLELPASATLDEVKKQYRRLALSYHPDRNPGKVDEFIPKFQAIQAAHEILGDAVQKTKYDTDRRKISLYPGLSTNATGGGAPRGNPYQATSAYPPPPRRTPQPGSPHPRAPPPPSNARPPGAERFSSFSTRPPTAKQADADGGRSNAFRAWQSMNNAQQQQSKFTPGAPPQEAPLPPKRPMPPPRQDTTFPSDEKIRAGFSHHRGPQTPLRPHSDRAEDRRSAWAAFQKADPASPGVSRSNTTRTPKKTGFNPQAPGADERAAPNSSHYVHRHRSEDFGVGGSMPPPPPGPPPSGPTSPRSSSAQRPFADPLRPFRSQTSDEDVPFAEGQRERTPYSSFIGEKTDFSGMRRAYSTRDTTKLASEQDESRVQSHGPHSRSADAENAGSGQCNPTRFSVGSGTSSEESSSPDEDGAVHSTQHASASQYNKDMPSHARPKKIPRSPSKRSNGTTAPTSPTDGPNLGNGNELPKPTANIFSFPIDHTSFQPTANGKSRSEESINTKFSAEGWNGTFSGTADYFAAPLGSRKGSPASRNGRPGMRSATSNLSRSPSVADHGSMPPPPPKPVSATDAPRSENGEVKFSSEQWQKTFSDPSWTLPPPPPPNPQAGAADTSRASRPVKKASRSNARARQGQNGASQPQAVDEADGTAYPVAAETAEPEPMDIDEASTPPVIPPPPAAQPRREPRLVSVPMPAWREQQAAEHTDGHRRHVSGGPIPPQVFMKTNLDDLANVAPFASRPTDSGLADLNPLAATLPFTSQAATTLPTNPMKPRTLQTPVVPMPPKAPSRLSKTTWHQFVQNFDVYLKAYHSFNTSMISHFAAREQQSQARLKSGASWLEAAGDLAGMGGQGFGSYAQGVREDAHVREVWSVGCNYHADAVKGFEEVRERVRKLAATGSLVER